MTRPRPAGSSARARVTSSPTARPTPAWSTTTASTTGSPSSAAHYSLDASDLNVPSIAIGDLAGSQTVTRKVTNVGTTAATYTSSASVSGMVVNVNPSSLTLA